MPLPLQLLLLAPLAIQADRTFAAVFDEHWEALRDDYAYFERYGVDWDAERAEHRPRAAAAQNATELAWEIARLLSVLRDAHVSFVPSPEVLVGWSYPEVSVKLVERRPLVVDWKDCAAPAPPVGLDGVPHPYPEIVRVQGVPFGSTVEILAAGPVGSEVELDLRWPDGSESQHVLRRPAAPNLPPEPKHYGERWIVSGRVGEVGYLRVRTFDPKLGTLGPEGKMTPILRAHLKELGDTAALILDLQGNGGGMVAASDPFLSHFLERRCSYRWGNSGGKRRRLVPRSPRYRGEVVVLVDAGSASGGEWAARILRDAGRAQVVGGRTAGAEAAVHRSTASDGSVVTYSAWPMVEPGVTPFQDRGVELDHALPLTVEAVREHGHEQALARVHRARFAKALELLGAPPEDVDAFLALTADEPPSEER